MNAAISFSFADRLADLGGISPERVRVDPPPGTATLEDLIQWQRKDDKQYELVDKTLVEKAMGWTEAYLASILAKWIGVFLDTHDLGVITGADGMTRLFGDTVRGPDVAFVSWERLPDGRLPTHPIPQLVPDFVIEVLSQGNTRGEMARKRREYFHAGVRLVWMVDPRDRSIAVFTAAEEFVVADETQTVDGGDVLPGWQMNVADLFAQLDRERPNH